MEDEKSSRGFKVEDRRRFSASGDPIVGEAEAKPSPQATSKPEAPPPPPPHPSANEAPPLGEMTLSTFVIGLSTQALILLGEIADPAAPAAPTDLAGAKQMIDILGMLQAKTRGNLDDAEAGLLENALYDLRMKYVQRMRSR